MKRTFVVVALALCLAVPVVAQQLTIDTVVTVEGMLALCKSPEFADATFCIGYVAATVEWADTVRSLVNSGALPKFPEECPLLTGALGVTAEQVKAVFVKWAESNPDKWNWDRQGGFTSAIAEAWPCKPTKDSDKP